LCGPDGVDHRDIRTYGQRPRLIIFALKVEV
jgi:hypothetical protein